MICSNDRIARANGSGRSTSIAGACRFWSPGTFNTSNGYGLPGDKVGALSE